MAWTSAPWIQDDSVNFGFPYTLEPAPQADLLNSKTIWNMNQNINFGFPYMLEPAPQADLSELKSIWGFSDDINFGFPYIRSLFKIYKWIEPVTDRKYSDIKNALELLKKFKWNQTIDFEFTKAFLNYTDLNRIEGNTEYLSNIFSVPDVKVKTNWILKNVPTTVDRERIIGNMAKICEKFIEEYPDKDLKNLPVKLSSYNDFNEFESVQLQLYQYANESGE